MDQRISFVTLAVADLEVSRRFYVEGLGWEPSYADDEVVMLQAGELLMLSLWHREAFEAEVGPIAAYDGVAPFALSHNVATPADVDAVLETARDAGAELVGDAQERAWGGSSLSGSPRDCSAEERSGGDEESRGVAYTGYFADPDGVRWEIAHNPGPIGQKVLP